jgi:Flp pilus assembly pilin Flp
MRTNSINKQRGQGMTEYIIIVALIAVAAIGVYQFLGGTIRNQTAGIAMEISGKSADAAITKAGDASTAASTSADKAKGLAAFDNKDSIGQTK